MKRSKLHTKGSALDGFDAGPLRQSIASGPVHDLLERTPSTRIRSRHRSEFAVTIQKRLGEAVSRGDDTPDQDSMRAEISLRGNDAFEPVSQFSIIGAAVAPDRTGTSTNGSSGRLAKCVASRSWPFARTWTAKTPLSRISACDRLLRLTTTRIEGGSAETLHTAVAVMPFASVS